MNLLVTQVMEMTSQIILESVTDATETVKLSYAALDRCWLPSVQESLVCSVNSKNFSLELDYVSHCGRWGFSKNNGRRVMEKDTPGDSSPAVSDVSAASTLAWIPKSHNQLQAEGFRIRPLTATDASLVNSKWEYRSSTSLQMIAEMIGGGDAESGCNLGVEEINTTNERLVGDRKLVAWILQYPDGPLGMLYCLI